MLFKKKKDRQNPEINTSALPDIIFMLLFYFMVATVLKSHTVHVAYDLPPASERSKLKSPNGIIHIYLGSDALTENSIQVNEFLVPFTKLEQVLEEIKSERMTEELRVSIKVDRKVPMHLVNDVKIILRKLDLRKLQYVALPSENAL